MLNIKLKDLSSAKPNAKQLANLQSSLSEL